MLNENIQRIKQGIKEHTRKLIQQKTDVLSYYTLDYIKKNNTLPMDYIFLDFKDYYPLFRVIINGYHINENLSRIKGKDKLQYFVNSIEKAIKMIDNDIYNNISIVKNNEYASFGIFVYDNKKDKNLLFVYPVDISVTHYLSNESISPSIISEIKDSINKNDKMKEVAKKLIKSNSCNGYNRLTAYLYNSYYIPTVLAPIMKLKDSTNTEDIYLDINNVINDNNKEEVVVEKKAFFINLMIDNLIHSKEKKENIYLNENSIFMEQKNWYHVKLYNYFNGYVDYSKNDYIVFPENVNFNNLKIIEVYIKK